MLHPAYASLKEHIKEVKKEALTMRHKHMGLVCPLIKLAFLFYRPKY